MHFPSQRWRLLTSGAASGAANMAVDEAILEAVRSGDSRPTLRLYAWGPPALSLGYAQSIEDVDLAGLRRQGWELVRRPTGGRSILHTDELTYAVIAPDDHPLLAGGVLASYHRLSRGLIRGLELLGVGAQVAPETPGSDDDSSNPVCFEVPSAYEITAQGQKLVGSAQVRRRGGVLQHGTVPLRGDLGRICLALKFPSAGARRRAQERVRRRAATVEQLRGKDVTWRTAAEAMRSGFQEALGLEFEAGDLTAQEQARAAELTDARRMDAAWTSRV